MGGKLLLKNWKPTPTKIPTVADQEQDADSSRGSQFTSARCESLCGRTGYVLAPLYYLKEELYHSVSSTQTLHSSAVVESVDLATQIRSIPVCTPVQAHAGRMC